MKKEREVSEKKGENDGDDNVGREDAGVEYEEEDGLQVDKKFRDG